jgi:hypothetical protein
VEVPIQISRKACRQLQGRYHFTMTFVIAFAKKLGQLARSLRASKDVKFSLSDVSAWFLESKKVAQKKIKVWLGGRLESSRRGKHSELLDEVLRIAIQADILDQPRIIRDDTMLKLVSNGFAVLDTGGQKEPEK